MECILIHVGSCSTAALSGEKACPPGEEDCGKCSFKGLPDMPSIKAVLMSSLSAASACNRTHPSRRPVRPPSDGQMPEPIRHKSSLWKHLTEQVGVSARRDPHPKQGSARLSIHWAIYKNRLIYWISNALPLKDPVCKIGKSLTYSP